MATHIIDIYEDNTKWYVLHDYLDFYVLVAEQTFTIEDGDTCQLGPRANFKVSLPKAMGHFAKYARIRWAPLDNFGAPYSWYKDTNCSAFFGKTMSEMRLFCSDFYKCKYLTTYGNYNTYTLKGSGSHPFWFYTGGSDSSGAYCPLAAWTIIGKDAAGKFFALYEGTGYGTNTQPPRLFYGNGQVPGGGYVQFSGTSTNDNWAGAFDVIVNGGNISSTRQSGDTIPSGGYIPCATMGSSGGTITSSNLVGYTGESPWTVNGVALNALYNDAYTTTPDVYLIIGAQVGYGDEVTPIMLNYESSDAAAAGDFAEYVPNDNPFGDNPDDPGTGGDGSRTDWTDSHPISDLPTFSALDSGTTAVYTPTAAQMANFTEFLWSDLFTVDSFKKLFADPMQSIISLHALPFAVTHGLQSQIVFGNISSGVNADVLGNQWYDIDMGTLDISEYYGNFFDYSPYTKYSIYLPYIGFREFIPDDFVRGTINLTYRVDALTGACSAILTSSTLNGVAYIYSGDMAYHLPVTASDYANFAAGIGSSVAAGAAAIKGIESASGALGLAAAIGSGIASTVSSVAGSKQQVSRSGSVGGAAGWTADQTPYIIRTRPNAVFPANAQKYQGFPSYKAYKLSSLSGFTKVLDCNLSLNGATSSEYDEALALLKEGVII